MRFLMLDDKAVRLRATKSRLPSLTTCETADECIALLQQGPWAVVFLDHDLGGEENVTTDHPNSGSAVVRWLAANPAGFENTTFVVHSFNANGGRYMQENLRAAGLTAHRLLYNGKDYWTTVDGLYEQSRTITEEAKQ